EGGGDGDERGDLGLHFENRAGDDEDDGAEEGDEDVELAGFEDEGFLAGEDVAEDAPAGGVEHADEHGGGRAQAGSERLLGAEDGVGAEAERVDGGDDSAEAMHPLSEEHPAECGGDDGLEVTR